MKVLVTGLSGFVGSHLLTPLSQIATLRALQRPGRSQKQRDSWRPLGVEVVEGDLTNAVSLPAAVDGVDVVIHGAALMSNFESEPYENFQATNVQGLKNLLEACKKRNPNAVFIFVSTVNVLGFSTDKPLDEDTPYETKGTKYARSKIEAEQVLRGENQLSWIILRPAQLYGEGMTYGWPQTLDKIKHRRFALPGDGRPRLHLTHVDDIVNGILLALNKLDRVAAFKNTGKAPIFHLAGPSAPKVREAFDYLADLLGVSRPKTVPLAVVLAVATVGQFIPQALKPAAMKILHPKMLDYFRNDHVYSTARAEEWLGFRPAVDYKTGLKRLVDWYQGGLN